RFHLPQRPEVPKNKAIFTSRLSVFGVKIL
ncbi:MAG: hypothetical protein ACI9V1_003459, partial [Spirosomataceae bacterium]